MSSPNYQHSDKYSITFSNIPGFVPNNSNTNNMDIYDVYVKAVTFPSQSIQLIENTHRAFHINHPISKKNEELDDLIVTFKLSEGMMNWFYIYNWIKELREGKNLNNEKFTRLNMIKEIRLTFLDNEKRPQFVYRFQNCFVTNVSSLSLTNGLDQELTFDLNIKYEDFGLDNGECKND